MIKMSGQSGHSAHVKMRLRLNGDSIRVVQMGPDFLILEAAAEHPPGDATIDLSIDANERSWKVRLPNGISSTSRTVTISRVI